MSDQTPDDARRPEPIEVPHAEFRTGLPAGRFRVIVDPVKATKYLKYRLLLTYVVLPFIAIGVLLALSGYTWVGLAMVIGGGAAHRIIQRQAPKMLLHMALQDARVYREAIDYEILEVRLAA